ncbi:MAG: flavodoxin-dependent (E)-4-hydroxy-3-methylbut-2-enyl-diphosphate synthase [Candidatus Omnitrophota bacterium]
MIRRKTRKVKVGSVAIGGNAGVSIQSMTKTDTRDVRATVRQINELERLGCDIIRVAVVDREAARAITGIKKGIKIPIVADIHFHYGLALEAIKAGADKIRLNPGNIRRKEDIAEVVRLARRQKVPVRIGVNAGSVTGEGAKGKGHGVRKSGLADTMVEATARYVKIFEELDFHDIVISLKASDVNETLEAYRHMAELCDYPFHIGITEAGSLRSGLVKSGVGIGILLAEGLGDTLRVSLTGDPADEVVAGIDILNALALRKKKIEVISCPTCGRCEVDLVSIVDELNAKLAANNQRPMTDKCIKVAVMGCVVNGPGESRGADIGIAAGKGCGILFKNGKVAGKVQEKDFVKVLLAEIKKAQR